MADRDGRLLAAWVDRPAAASFLQHDGMIGAARLKGLEENARLKKRLAREMLDAAALRDLATAS